MQTEKCAHAVPVFGCAGCITQRDFGFPPVIVSWFRPRKDAKQQGRNVARGLHPMGMRVHDEAEARKLRCGDCVHSFRRGNVATYIKCALTKVTCGGATDIRAGWFACEKFESET